MIVHHRGTPVPSTGATGQAEGTEKNSLGMVIVRAMVGLGIV